MTEIETLLCKYPIVAAIKSDNQIDDCVESESHVVFVLYGNINTVPQIVDRLKKAGKTVFVHIDLIEGLSAREPSVDYLQSNTNLDGIISTKVHLLKFAKSKGLMTVMRFFLIDSMAMENISKISSEHAVDIVEVLPGLMPKIIKKISKSSKKPIIAGGLITDKCDIVSALDAGAVAVSSTNENVWTM